MSPDVVISARGLSKSYRLFGHPGDRVKQFLSFGLKRYYREFTALRDVSFDVRRGEMLGIIGRNGSGKSTLRQLICGSLKPTSGSVVVNGRISALLELGAGFNPEFTGRENVYFHGALMGFTQGQMDARFDAIAAFADIGEFIDQSVRTYSSGMFVRLAFASAIHVDPDILIVDEALAVGDLAFQRKCFAQIDRIRDAGCTIVFVSHDMGAIASHCDRALLLDRGELSLAGSPKQAIDRYLADDAKRSLAPGSLSPATPCYDPALIPQSTLAYPRHGAEILAPRILSLEGEPANLLQRGREYLYVFDVRFDVPGEDIRFGMLIKTLDGQELGGLTSSQQGAGIKADAGMELRQCFRFHCNLLPGTYFVNAGVVDASGNYLHRIIDAAMFSVLPDPHSCGTGIVDITSSS